MLASHKEEAAIRAAQRALPAIRASVKRLDDAAHDVRRERTTRLVWRLGRATELLRSLSRPWVHATVYSTGLIGDTIVGVDGLEHATEATAFVRVLMQPATFLAAARHGAPVRRWKGARLGAAPTGRARWHSLGDRVRARFGERVTVTSRAAKEAKPIVPVADRHVNGVAVKPEPSARDAGTLARIERALLEATRDDATMAIKVLEAVLEAGTLKVLACAPLASLSKAQRLNPPCAGLAMPHKDALDAVRPYLFAD